MVLSANFKFQSLSVRPPTPPKDLDDTSDKVSATDADADADNLLDFLHDPFGTKEPIATLAPTKSLLNTPDQSPSSDGGIPSSSASRKKRVNFQPQPCKTQLSALPPQSYTPLRSSPLRPLPQTRVSKPLKSILKPSDAASTPPPADQGAPAHKYKSFAEMLESIIKQLASGRRSSSVDAYHSLHRTMQAYDKIPDIQALLDKMGLLTHFIRRDMQAVSINGSGLDSQLIGQALKLLMALVRLPELRPAMDDEFCNFVVDRIIHVAADQTMPKAIINTHLAMLMQQTFRQKTMTVMRVEKILDVLDTIHDRVTGFSVLAYRIRIYRKLIQQRHEVMSKHAERWFRHTIKALLSTQKDILHSALDLVYSAAKAIGTDRQVNKAVLAILNRTKNDGDTYAKVAAKELDRMLHLDNGSLVPQIWAAITALLPACLNRSDFPALADWLMVFQNCCNSNNDTVKMDANSAYGCLIYAVAGRENEDTLSNWSKMLLSIPQYQLQRRGPSKRAERDSATSAYFTLLYYSLRPLASHKQLDRCWTDFVENFWTPLVQPPSPVHAFAACRVLSVLFNGTQKTWDPQRALDLWNRAMLQRRDSKPQDHMQREELPVLDAKWVRKSLSTILKFVEVLLNAAPWGVEDCKDEPVKTMWLSLLQSLKAASAKEVMASAESKDAMAYIVNLLRRVWGRHTAQLALSQETEDTWADKFCFLVETTVDRLGPMQFSDKCLTRNGPDDFEVSSTPSHRSRQNGPRVSPLIHFVDLLVNQSEEKLSDKVRLRALNSVIGPCFDIQNTRLGRLELLRDCGAMVNSSTTAMCTSFWMQTAPLVKACIEEASSDSNGTSRQFGKEYEVVVDIFRMGSPVLMQQCLGRDVLVSFVNAVRGEAGDGALVLAVVEKISECIIKQVSADEQNIALPWLSVLLRNLPTAVGRRILEQGRQKLWPSSSMATRNQDFDPYNHFYDAVVSVGSAAYQDARSGNLDIIREFLAALASSVKTFPIALLAGYLRKVQAAIRLWVEDSERKMQHKDQRSRELHAQVILLWGEVCAAVERLPRRDGQTLLHLEPLMTAGFLSQRRGVVNTSITTWNRTFGKEDTLRYPAQLEQALRRLHSTVDLSLPSLDVREEDDMHVPSFYDSDDAIGNTKHSVKGSRVKESPFKIVKDSRKSRSPAVVKAASRTPTRRTPRVRLRHDNSQIQFEPINSSPSNPFVQESWILTGRQREMVERQMASTLFADLGSAASSTRHEATVSVHSPSELHSDSVGADDLPRETARTPLRSLSSLGPMDVFVGSSPTPQARNRTQEVMSDQTSVATPTAVRTSQLGDDGTLGSSPPRFEKDAATIANGRLSNTSEDVADESSPYNSPEQSFSFSFDEGTTFDDTVLAQPGMNSEVAAKDSVATESSASDMPSSTIDMQLIAQIDADMQAQVEVYSSKPAENSSQDAESAAVALASVEEDGQRSTWDYHNEDAQVEDTQVEMSTQAKEAMPNSGTSSTSRIGDSFSSQPLESPQVRSLRSSQRISATSSPSQPASSTKRKSSRRGRGRPRKSRAAETEAEENKVSTTTAEQNQGLGGMLDNIIVGFPRQKPGTKRAGRILLGPRESEVVKSETNRKRAIRRSVSLLGEADNQLDKIVDEDTPTTKRARRGASQDVSSAKKSSKRSKAAQSAQLSHVQVTPRRSSELDSSVRGSAVAVNKTAKQTADAGETAVVGEKVAEVTLQLPTDGDVAREARQSQASVATPSRSFAERVILTPRSIINQLRNLKDALFRSSQLVLGRQEERDIDDALFELRREVHEAGRRAEDRS